MKTTIKFMGFIVIVTIIFNSCRNSKLAYMAIYESIAGMNTSYIILKSQPHSCEIYSPNVEFTELGTWETHGDTLIVNPSFCYNGFLRVINVDVNDTTEVWLQRRYLIENKKLIDITDYSPIYLKTGALIATKYKPAEYNRIK